MAAPTLSNFREEIRSRNIARPNLFYVEITPPTSLIGKVENRLASMWCHAAQTPHMFLMTNDNFFEAGVKRKYAYDVDFQNLVLNFYVDQDYRVKQFFDAWKQLIVPYNRNFNYPDTYTASNLTLYIINQESKVTYKYEYKNVYPKTINSMDLNYANGASILDLNVEFVFEDVYYTTLNDAIESDISTSKPPTANFDYTGIRSMNTEISQQNMEK